MLIMTDSRVFKLFLNSIFLKNTIPELYVRILFKNKTKVNEYTKIYSGKELRMNGLMVPFCDSIILKYIVKSPYEYNTLMNTKDSNSLAITILNSTTKMEYSSRAVNQ